MNYYLRLMSVVSIIIAAVLSPLITRQIMYMVKNSPDRESPLLAAPVGSAMLFALVFVVVWCAASFVLAVPWLLARSRKRLNDRCRPREKRQR